MEEGDKIFWPPYKQKAMTALGFKEVRQTTQAVVIDKEFSIHVATLAGIFLLKLMAWKDRHIQNNKDAADMAFIFNNYLSINDKRAARFHYDEIYLIDNFTPNKAGAKLLGIDIATMTKANLHLSQIISDIITKEVEKGIRSKLVNQILETNNYFDYEEIRETLMYLREGLNS